MRQNKDDLQRRAINSKDVRELSLSENGSVGGRPDQVRSDNKNNKRKKKMNKNQNTVTETDDIMSRRKESLPKSSLYIPDDLENDNIISIRNSNLEPEMNEKDIIRASETRY